ncbi:peptidoglycan DD-metalloendopeptidase family protein [Thermodesulfobacteriota bacterium]
MKDIKIQTGTYLPDIGPEVQNQEKLKKACREMESIFTYELLKSMRRTVEKSDLLHGGREEEIYESFLDQELAKTMAGGDNSLGAMLYDQLKRTLASQEGDENGMSVGIHKRGQQPLWPLKASVTSDFGWRKDPINGQNRYHYGIDLGAQEGSPVRAVLPGRVVTSDYREGYGNCVVLDHGHGFTSLYGHNQTNTVKQGDWVRSGTPIAKVGSSGRSTGPHLHFEVRRFGKHLDPIEFFAEVPEG